MTTFSVVRAAVAASLCLALAGCMLGRQSSPITVLAPQVAVAASPGWPVVDWSLQIDRPRADAMRDSARVLVRPTPSQLQVYKGAAWHEPAPDMLQSILLQAFEDSGKIAAVSRAGSVRSRYRLHAEIRHFEAVEAGDGALAVQLEIQAKLILSRNANVLSSTTITTRAESADGRLPSLTKAFEQALKELAGSVVGWTLEQGELAEAKNDEQG